MSFRAQIDAICIGLPGAEKSDPWGGGHDAWKLCDKMFACIGSAGAGVSVKCADVETAQMLIETGVGIKAPYFHRSWVLLPEDTEPEEIRFRLTRSYDLIRSKLPKKLQATLSPREAD